MKIEKKRISHACIDIGPKIFIKFSIIMHILEEIILIISNEKLEILDHSFNFVTL